MSFVDYIIVAVVVLAAVGALILYAPASPPATAEPGCASCPRACAQKQKGTSDAPQ